MRIAKRKRGVGQLQHTPIFSPTRFVGIFAWLRAESWDRRKKNSRLIASILRNLLHRCEAYNIIITTYSTPELHVFSRAINFTLSFDIKDKVTV